MIQTLADRVSFIHNAERRLSGLAPYTAGWLDVQRIIVRARADYWDAIGQDWDRNHRPRPAAVWPNWRI